MQTMTILAGVVAVAALLVASCRGGGSDEECPTMRGSMLVSKPRS